MGLYQSYQQVFVTNSPALLASGKTVDSLAVGQFGILDGKTYLATTTPTYANNKALYFVWGTPNVTLGDFGGMPNENEYTKLIKGKLIKRFRAKKAAHGQTPVYTVGWSGGVSDTDTLSAKAGQSKSLFIKLTGTIIDRLYDKQGVIKEFVTTPACIDDCSDTCANVLCPALAYELADQINKDKDFSKFIRAKAIVQCSGVDAPSTTTCYKFALDVCDTGDQAALGLVQSLYPNEDITVVGRTGSITTYGVVESTNSAPANFDGITSIPADCGTCPSGYTYQAADPDADPALKEKCLLTDTPNIAWYGNGTLLKQSQVYTLTIGDSICGTNRLTDLQAAYPDLTVAVVDSSGSCVHTYTTTVSSACYESGCAVESVVFAPPALFEGVTWVPTPATPPADDATCLCGIQIETSFFNKVTNECTFDAFPYENDVVHVQISNYNPDFNADPCEGSWAVKQIRQVQYPQGHGAFVQRLEKESKAYDARTRAWDAVVREYQGYEFQAKANQFYDQYALEFDTKFFTSGGWSEQYTESFTLNLFVPEGTGDALEAAVNGYLVSAGIDEDGVVLP